jgi:hypothetical protein
MTQPDNPNEATTQGLEVALLTCASLAEAEDLLDWLENQGCTQIVLSLSGEQVTVCCRCPAGQRLVRDEAGAVRLRPA